MFPTPGSWQTNNGTINAACIQLATNPSVNWRDASLKIDQENVSCLSKTLGSPIGYGEKGQTNSVKSVP